MPVNGVSNTQASALAYVRNDVSASAGELTMHDSHPPPAAHPNFSRHSSCTRMRTIRWTRRR